jgi:hypothetical protein
VTDAFVTVPVALDVQSLRVETAAAVTMGILIEIVILNGFVLHRAPLLSGMVFGKGFLPCPESPCIIKDIDHAIKYNWTSSLIISSHASRKG